MLLQNPSLHRRWGSIVSCFTDRSQSVPSCTHRSAVSRVCAGWNLKSSMNTEPDRPIIRCTLSSASSPLKGSRCENPVTFTRDDTMTIQWHRQQQKPQLSQGIEMDGFVNLVLSFNLFCGLPHFKLQNILISCRDVSQKLKCMRLHSLLKVPVWLLLYMIWFCLNFMCHTSSPEIVI